MIKKRITLTTKDDKVANQQKKKLIIHLWQHKVISVECVARSMFIFELSLKSEEVLIKLRLSL